MREEDLNPELLCWKNKKVTIKLHSSLQMLNISHMDFREATTSNFWNLVHINGQGIRQWSAVSIQPNSKSHSISNF